jgi:pimeloyl-ACP methyl ester carboxylesterase
VHPATPERIPHVGELRGSVIVLHGYGANGAVHRGDGRAFGGDGVEVLLPDAPGHGRRDDGRLERIARLDEAPRRAAIVGLARDWIPELRRLACECRARGARRVVLVGISMGGFAALGALRPPCSFDAIAALLAAPHLIDDEQVERDHAPLLLGLAGRDQAVPPAPGRAFAQRHGAELFEYPDSEHLMRGEDWHDLWGRTAAFVQRHVQA